MKFPRWTTYPAIALLLGMAILAVPHKRPHPLATGVPAPKFSRMVVIGIDGLDPDILKQTIERFPDRMTHFRELVDAHGLHELGTSNPPQSPVAWSNFITGREPGGHGVFDFIHRDLTTREPLPSTTKSTAESSVDLPGGWQFPLGGDSSSNRSGKAFWTVLAEHHVPADIWRIPANFPVEKAQGLSFSGMFTPAIDSAYGQFTFYTTNPPTDSRAFGKHKIVSVSVRDGCVHSMLEGPPNSFKQPAQPHASSPASTIPLVAHIDEAHDAAAIECGDRPVVLKAGQWSDFVPVTFSLLSLGVADVHGIVRFYLRSVKPEFELYASPVNIDPKNPAAAVSDPKSASAKLAAPPPEGIGYYYTQGMAEDVGALKAEVLTVPEFMDQAQLVHDESTRMLDYALDHYLTEQDGGLLFFYFSSVDLCSHMMWRHFDDEHPHHDPKFAAADSSKWSHRAGSTWKEAIYDLYLRMDPVLARVRDRVGPDATIVVMSDHGFAPYRRKFNLNTWLVQQGYLVLKGGKQLDPSARESLTIMSDVDWSKSRAYGMGFQGLYLNLATRERDDPRTLGVDESGIVKPGAEADALLAELKAKLESVIDPKNGEHVVYRCDLAKAIYSGERASEAPDIVVGYNSGYDNSDESSTGAIPTEVLEDNLGGTFNGSHLMAPELVEGTLLSNRNVRPGKHQLVDLTVDILAHYGVPAEPGMKGSPVLENH